MPSPSAAGHETRVTSGHRRLASARSLIPSSIRRSIRKCGISISSPYAAAPTPRGTPPRAIRRVRPCPSGLQGERAPALEPERASRLEHAHPESARRMQVDGFAQLAVLPLRVDAVGVLHLAAGEVLEPLVAVEAAAILAELGEPGPHLLDRRVDRHRVEDPGPVLGKKLVAWQLALLVLRFGAPTQVPGPDHKRIQRRRGRAEQRQRRGPAERDGRRGRRQRCLPRRRRRERSTRRASPRRRARPPAAGGGAS